jgi:hypothetical protein
MLPRAIAKKLWQSMSSVEVESFSAYALPGQESQGLEYHEILVPEEQAEVFPVGSLVFWTSDPEVPVHAEGDQKVGTWAVLQVKGYTKCNGITFNQVFFNKYLRDFDGDMVVITTLGFLAGIITEPIVRDLPSVSTKLKSAKKKTTVDNIMQVIAREDSNIGAATNPVFNLFTHLVSMDRLDIWFEPAIYNGHQDIIGGLPATWGNGLSAMQQQTIEQKKHGCQVLFTGADIPTVIAYISSVYELNIPMASEKSSHLIKSRYFSTAKALSTDINLAKEPIKQYEDMLTYLKAVNYFNLSYLEEIWSGYYMPEFGGEFQEDRALQFKLEHAASRIAASMPAAKMNQLNGLAHALYNEYLGKLDEAKSQPVFDFNIVASHICFLAEAVEATLSPEAKLFLGLECLHARRKADEYGSNLSLVFGYLVIKSIKAVNIVREVTSGNWAPTCSINPEAFIDSSTLNEVWEFAHVRLDNSIRVTLFDKKAKLQLAKNKLLIAQVVAKLPAHKLVAEASHAVLLEGNVVGFVSANVNNNYSGTGTLSLKHEGVETSVFVPDAVEGYVPESYELTIDVTDDGQFVDEDIVDDGYDPLGDED